MNVQTYIYVYMCVVLRLGRHTIARRWSVFRSTPRHIDT